MRRRTNEAEFGRGTAELGEYNFGKTTQKGLLPKIVRAKCCACARVWGSGVKVRPPLDQLLQVEWSWNLIVCHTWHTQLALAGFTVLKATVFFVSWKNVPILSVTCALYVLWTLKTRKTQPQEAYHLAGASKMLRILVCRWSELCKETIHDEQRCLLPVINLQILNRTCTFPLNSPSAHMTHLSIFERWNCYTVPVLDILHLRMTCIRVHCGIIVVLLCAKFSWTARNKQSCLLPVWFLAKLLKTTTRSSNFGNNYVRATKNDWDCGTLLRIVQISFKKTRIFLLFLLF